MVVWGQLPKRHTCSADGMTRSRKYHISLLNGLGLVDAIQNVTNVEDIINARMFQNQSAFRRPILPLPPLPPNASSSVPSSAFSNLSLIVRPLPIDLAPPPLPLPTLIILTIQSLSHITIANIGRRIGMNGEGWRTISSSLDIVE
jgi:hypothetical protein